MGDLRATAALEQGSRRLIPYRGTLHGIEAALLDLAARSYGTRLADLLGANREHVSAIARSISLDQPTEAFEPRYSRQRARPCVRFVLGTDANAGVRNLVVLAKRYERKSAAQPVWWIEAGGHLAVSDAEELVLDLAKWMRRDVLPARVIVEQPVAAAERTAMARMQRRADKATARGRRSGLDLRIMADEGLASAEDLRELTADGGCRALNIKSARVGGLLTSIDLVQRAVERNPTVTVALSGMAGTSDVSYRAAQQLGLALPRLDYFTMQPPSSDATRITEARSTQLGGSGDLQDPSDLGIGVDIRFSAALSVATDR
jgi:L-alanine-DL-glutamate epimerase-like enolase superfamily enzyme